MKSKIFLTVLTTLIMAATLVWAPSAVLASDACDPDYVTQAGQVISVSPTGVDDTVNLQCAFDLAGAAGTGIEIRLLTGTFHTAQIVVNNFYGTFSGAGIDETVITNLPNLYVTPVDMYFELPSATNPWPSLLSFVNGEIYITNLAIHIIGNDGTTGWSIWGINPPIIELAGGIMILGTNVSARVEHILIEGELMEGSLYGYNLINGIIFQGNVGEIPVPISGSFEVYDSTFRRVGGGTPLFNLSGSTVIISRNTYEDCFDAMDAADIVGSSIEFSRNTINALYGTWLYNVYTTEYNDSSFLIKNNVFRGVYGQVFDQTFGQGNTCLLLGNNVQNVTDIGIYLGPGTSGCTVVGGVNRTTVLDLGTDNILVGVNNMGTGVGPTIQPFLKHYK